MPVTRSSRPRPVLSDGVVLLRTEDTGDADDIAAACNDARSAAWSPVPVPYGPTDANDWLAQRASDEDWWARPVWAITTPPSRRWSGSVSLRPDGAGGADVGYLIAPWARGAGLAERALRLACAFGFGSMGLQVITWCAYVGNEASRRTARQVGFDIPGHVFARWAVQRGVRRDCWLGTLTPEALVRATRYSDRYHDEAGRPLTTREQQVLACLARGDTNRELAEELGISENTAKNHVRAVLEKLSARSRAEAVVEALREGLVTLHTEPDSVRQRRSGPGS